MGDMNFPESPAVDDGYLDWSWDGEKWVHNGLTGLESKPANITTADVKLTNPQRSDFNNQEDANQYFYDSIQSGGGGGEPFPEAPLDGKQYGRQGAGWTEIVHPNGGDGGSVDLSNYYTKPQADDKFQLKGNYLTEFTEEDPTVPSYVKSISQADIDKWNNPPTGGGGGGAVDSVNGKTGTVVLNYTDVGAQQAGSYAASNHNHNGVYQPAGSYAASNHNHSGVYAPASHTHNYAAVGASYTKSESDGKYALKGSGGDDPNAVKLTGNQTVMGVKKFLGGSTYFQNLFIEGVPAGGVGFAGQSRIEFSSGATTLYGSSNTLQVNSAGTSITGGIVCTGTIMSVDNVGGTSFTSTVGGTQLCTLYGHALANGGANGAGLYFTRDSAPQILPCRGSDYATTDNQITLGNPNKRFSKVWAVGGVSSTRRHTQNDNEAVLSVNDLIDVLDELRSATQEEKTIEGLRDSIGNCVGGIIEKLEAIQAETEEQLAQELEVYKQGPEPEPLPPLNIPEPPDFKSITNGEI